MSQSIIKKGTIQQERNNIKSLAVRVDGVSKCFVMPKLKYDKLSELLGRPWLYLKKEKFCPLQNITFEVEKGEMFAIIGPNGAGKSTLLKVLANVYAPDVGRVEIFGKLVPFLELGVGFHPDLTVRENLFLNGLILGMTRGFLKKNFRRIIAFAELQEFVDVPLKNLSSGMQVRLAFSIAFLSEADVYLLDEVIAVGDISFQQKSKKVIDNLRRQGKTIILVTHDIEYVKKNASRALLLWDHRVAKIGTPEDVIKDYLKRMEYKDETR